MKYVVPVLLALSLGAACNRTETKAAAAADQTAATGTAQPAMYRDLSLRRLFEEEYNEKSKDILKIMYTK